MTGSTSRLRLGTVSPVPSFDPREALADAAAQVTDLVFESPFRQSFGHAEAEATLLDHHGSEDGAHRFRCREGVRFSDGTPLSPERLATAIRETAVFGPRHRVELDGDILTLHVDAPLHRLQIQLSTQAQMLSLQGEGGRHLGTGPYQVAANSTAERVRLERNPHARERPHFDEIHLIAFDPAHGGTDALRKGLEDGEIDLTISLPSEEAEGLEGLVVDVVAEASTALLFFNSEKPALSQASTRRAIAHALDRDDLARCARAGWNPPTDALLPPMIASHREVPPPDWPEYDRESGRAGVHAAGLDGARLRLVLPWAPRGYLADPWGVGERIVRQLASAGVVVDLVSTSDPRHALDQAQSGDYELFLTGWSCDTADPRDYLDALLRSDAIPQPSASTRPLSTSFNLGRIRSPALDKALSDYRRRPEDARLERLHAAVAMELPLLPICHGYTTLVHRSDLPKPRLIGPRLLDLRGIGA